MSRSRMPWLLAILAAVLVLRVWDWRQHDRRNDLSEAVVRPRTIAALDQKTSEVVPAAVGSDPSRDLDVTEPGNAFAVRLPPAAPTPPAAPPPPRPARVKPFVGPPLPPPPPPPIVAPMPAVQVIGTWEDASGMSVFLAGQLSTMQLRVGDVLLSDYQVVQITRQQVLLHHRPTQQDVRLPVPMASATTVAGRL